MNDRANLTSLVSLSGRLLDEHRAPADDIVALARAEASRVLATAVPVTVPEALTMVKATAVAVFSDPIRELATQELRRAAGGAM